MISYKVLNAYGTSNNQLRRYFTSKNVKETFHAKRTEFLRYIEDLINEGVEWSLRNYSLYAAGDLMWAPAPVGPENLPLTLFAQGRIKIDDLEKQLDALNVSEKFIQKKSEGGKVVKSVNIGKLHDICVNIGRSYISRRAFAQTNKYNNLYPFFKYDTLSSSQVAKVRGEVMSQYSEIMTNAYGYRHQHTQIVRDMLLYGHVVAMPASSWDKNVDLVEAPGEKLEGGVELAPNGKTRIRSKISREGVPMVVVHPSRVFHDRAFPLSSLNTNTGCKWIGFWDVKRYRDIRTNSAFFNRDNICYSKRGGSLLDANRSYFDLYFAGQTINFPKSDRRAIGDLTSINDAKTQQDVYSTNTDNDSIFFTDIRIEVVPKDWGMGNFPKPVWLRLIVAADNTVIFAEWMPSSVPAAVFSFNEKDDHVNSLSMAHEIMPWQDQLSNLMSNLLLVMKHSLLRIIAINKDVIDDEMIAKIQESLNGSGYYSVPHILKYSLKKYQDLNIQPPTDGGVIDIVQAQSQQEYINMTFRAIVQILSIVERLQILSPQELGQPAPREITAQEVSSIETATSAVYSAISEAIDEGRAAWKRIIYESAVAKGSQAQFVPVSQRFPKRIIEAAGFEVISPEEEADTDSAVRNEAHDVIAMPKGLAYDYVFTGRDGGDRIQNQQAATVLVQLLGQVLPLIGPGAFKTQQLYDIVNEAFRLVGLYDLKLEVEDGQPDTIGGVDQVQQQLQQITAQVQQALQQAADENANNKQQIAAVATSLAQLSGVVGKMAEKQPIREGEVAPGVPGGAPIPAPANIPAPVEMGQQFQPIQA